MTKRLSAGVLLSAVFVLAFAMTANAERLQPKEWSEASDPYRELPLFFRASAGTAWVAVGTAGCDSNFTASGGDIHDGTDHTESEVWCFETADSLWPAGPGGDPNYNWRHWSRNAPPNGIANKWHITTLYGDGATGGGNAWVGCSAADANNPCDDIAFWINQSGYADEWEETLTMDVSSLGGGSGGTLTFSLRYDTECVYDYLYLEYLDTNTGDWEVMTDSATTDSLGNVVQFGTAAVFNGVSGIAGLATNAPCDNGAGGTSDGNYFDDGTQWDPGSGTEPYHGNSTWYHSVSFPVPEQATLQMRWRGSSDPAWSDFDGRGDTHGIGAIDNVSLLFNNGDMVTDSFEFGTFDFAFVNGVPDANVWMAGSGGNTYDGWHLTFDPMYKNKGATCTFSDDWMWAAKPDIGSIPENGFEFFLTSPVIPCDGWSGGTAIWSGYQCAADERNDFTNTHLRIYDSVIMQWSPWTDFDGFVIFAGCEFWNINASENLTPFLGTSVDSLQMGFELLDGSSAGDFSWGKHGAVQWVIDNVTFGSFDGTGTVFVLRGIDTFADTFSRADPAHTPFLQNAEQGIWTGRNVGTSTRNFANADSFTVQITDQDGLSANVPTMHYRTDNGPGTAYGAWKSVPMDLALVDPTGTPGEGTYRAVLGDDEGGIHDQTGAMDGLVWNAGTTVEYYIRVDDDAANVAYWPGAADPLTLPAPTFAEFSILPFNVASTGNVASSFDANGTPVDSAGGHFVLLVDDYTRAATDFENSTGFNPTGGAGFGAFTGAVTRQPEDMTEAALAMLYGAVDADGNGSWTQHDGEAHWDKYDVVGGGSSVQCEPNGVSKDGVGAYMTDAVTPYYDALIWLQGTFDAYSYADTTRLELATYLEVSKAGPAAHGLFSTGDQVAFHLGSGGNNADSSFAFGAEYLGISLTVPADELTGDRVLNYTGAGAMTGLKFGVYGECPIRRTFDRLNLSAPIGDGIVSSLGTYTDSSDPADNGRIAATECIQPGGGIGVHYAFGIEALTSDGARAVVVGRFLRDILGLSGVNIPGDVDNDGVDAPVIANGFGFSLAQARPNPFQDATAIQFSVPTKTHVSIEVYNILGQKVRTLVNENMEPDSYVRDWDGRSDSGAQVSSGIYFYKMVAGEFSATKKAVLLK